MSDLVKRDDEEYPPTSDLVSAISNGNGYKSRIEKWERELRECRMHARMDAGQIQTAYEELAAEKALADRLWDAWQHNGYAPDAVASYRKARGL
jgi:hypothetical protein